MDCKTDFIDYGDTGYFSRLMTDYLKEDPSLKPFYTYSPADPDFGQAMAARDAFPTDRALLTSELRSQYKGMEVHERLRENLELLERPDTYTVCTAHQPNLFTGYLYFVYKVLHAVKLAAFLTEKYPGKHFVPVYYMGSEDADLDELGTVHVEGRTYRWQTGQQGAVGRMTPEGLAAMIDQVTERLGVDGPAAGLRQILREAYLEHPDIQTGTLWLVNALFGRFGLVVLIADTPGFKRAFSPVMERELFGQESFPVVSATIDRFPKAYHAQATPREINLFYLGDQLRERIIRTADKWEVLHTGISFTEAELRRELETHPERFSPNVILRGLLQETILPDIAFIGGGGELAYWLELKEVFAHFRVPFPALMLRNSLMWVEERAVKKLRKIDLAPAELFRDTEAVVSDFVRRHTRQDLVLKKEYRETEALYEDLSRKALLIDVTLGATVAAQKKKALCQLGKLEHKFLKAEKKKFAWQAEAIRSLQAQLFPGGGLQERVENLLPFYARYGPAFFDEVYKVLDPLNKAFTIVSCEPSKP
jgi:bacillithiol biosynthesis cysteine-adding enzyme BshC